MLDKERAEYFWEERRKTCASIENHCERDEVGPPDGDVQRCEDGLGRQEGLRR